MENKPRIPYDLKALRERVPGDSAEFFLGFAPWTEDAEGWKRSVKESLPEKPGRLLVKTVWDDPKDQNSRVLIEVVECMSAAGAVEALYDRLIWNQLARLEEGPRELGYVSFTHPEGVPPAILFTRGNLCIGVISFGRQPVAVKPWAERLHRRLVEIPSVERKAISLLVEGASFKISQEVEIRYSLPWRYGEEGYLKFFVMGGTLVRRDGRMFFMGTKTGQAVVNAYVLEPGREPVAGHIGIAIE